MKAPLPSDEAGRLKALRRYAVLDSPPEQAFDDLILLAAHICQVPTAMVSLVDENRQWFKSRMGLKVTETSRDIAFCAHTILRPDEVMVISDAAADPRFADNPLVTGDPHFRFYAAAPLVTPDGQALGALCVMDYKPRSLTPDQLTALQALSRRTVAQLELRWQAGALQAQEREASRLLIIAEKSRRALLSLLEDEKLSAKNLRESETRFRQVVENIHEVFWMTETDKSRILFISPAYERIWGRPGDELYDSPQAWLDAIIPEDRERVREAAATKQILGTYREEYRIKRPDGTIRWVSDRAFPIRDAEGRVYRVVGVAEDITERKKLEDQFLRAQRLEAIGTLASGVAHDLNNILSPVLLVSGLLKEKLTEPEDQQMMRMVEISAKRGAAIIRQLLTYSRGVEATQVSVQLRHLIREMVHIMQETFPRNLAIEQKVNPDLWCVNANATQMHQVLLNLCVNARDAMPEGGRLSISAENQPLPEMTELSLGAGLVGPLVVITVTDTGTGIPEEIIDHIFDPFFTTKELGKGTGLGLSTVMGIVKSHGGLVAVTSDPGHGTEFKIYLPSTEGKGVPAVEGSDLALPGGHGELILVVDDEEAIRTATHGLLEQYNYRVLLARDGKEALIQFLANQDRVRLILTDVMMPVMGGLDLARALRNLQLPIPIIATTGLDQDGKRVELSALDVTEVLSKPFVPHDLLSAIRRQLDSKPSG